VTTHGDDRGEVPQRLWLLGEMGAGKSTTGRALATALAWRYLDNDDELERATQHTLLELEGRGAAALHGAEHDVARSFFEASPPLVAGLAASIIDDTALVGQMRRAGRSVYLDLPEAVLRARVRGTPRPWLHVPPASRALMHERRRARFVRSADVVLDGTAGVDSIVERLLTLSARWWPRTVRHDGRGA
jgi:shikimate kinase